MSDGVVKASVYGGGEMASVGESRTLGETLTTGLDGNTYVTVSGGTIGKSGFGGAKMGNVYGGGSGHHNTVRSGQIYGNTNVNISGGRIYHNIYGGGAYGTVGDFTYTMQHDDAAGTNKVVGINGLHADRSGTGTTMVTITGGTIGTDGHENGMVFGSSRGDINMPGERDDYTAWVNNANVTIGTAAVPASGSEEGGDYVAAVPASGPDIKGSVYGSGENGHTFNNTVVTVNGGTIGIATGEAVGGLSGAAYPYRGNVYGGGCGTDMYDSDSDGTEDSFNALAGVVYGTTTVNINGGTVVRNVYGAGAMGSVGKAVTANDVTTVTGGTTTINVRGGTIGVDGTVGDGNVFGAARGDVDATINAYALVRKETDVKVTGGTIKGNVYGGGELGCVGTFTVSSDYRTFTWKDTDGNTNTAANTDSKNTGICNVTVDGSSAVINGHVFGAGKGKDDTFWCEKGIAYSTNVSITNGTVNSNVYGGGEVGRVETNTEVKVGIAPEEGGGTSEPTINGSVFGGGAGVETHGYSALVRNNTTVTVDESAHVRHSVYGGGEIASVGKYGLDESNMPSILQGGGYCYVTVQGNATVGEDVFGAGKGVTPHFDSTNEDLSKRSRRMTLKSGWQSLVGAARFDWDYLTESNYPTYLETLALVTHPEVTIDGSAAVSGSVFGGGELGITKGSVIVNIEGGTIAEDVYGGGSLANTNTTTKADLDNDGVLETVSPTTTVKLMGGTIGGDAYGGGLGRLAKGAAVTAVEAKVYGDVLVELNGTTTKTTEGGVTVYGTTPTSSSEKGCTVGRIFGCNNLNGSPKGEVLVHVHATQKAGAASLSVKSAATKNSDGDYDVTSFDVKAVYGGGNLAAYVPDDTDEKTEVIIDGCGLTSIGQVYGGGNAASAPATEVTVNGTFEIGQLFGGGNGYDDITVNGVTMPNPGANVGYKNYSEYYQENGVWKVRDKADAITKELRMASSYVYGTGVARAYIYGGTIHSVYGGSNSKGNIRTLAHVILDDMDDCSFNIGEAYGGGKNANMDGEARLEIRCISKLGAVYGGAENADVLNNVTLNITNGTYDQVFGGNKSGGRIGGAITVNVEETGCKPVIIGELYAGGNLAAYSKYGYKKVGGKWEPRESSTDTGGTEQYTEGVPYGNPTLNVKSFTSIGAIYGGGYGSPAKMVADPTVKIDVVKGKFADDDKSVYGEVVKLIDGDHVTLPAHEKGKIGAIWNVFGGGNQAEVIGSPNVLVGTQSTVRYVTDDAATEDVDETKIEQNVVGVKIIGNVFGGGNNANVTGNPNVVIGRKKQ